MAVAPRTMSGPPISIAGEAFMTFPPTVPCNRVAREPTIADASASAVSRSRMKGSAAIWAWVTSAPSASPPSDRLVPRSSSRRWMATMVSGSGALP